jgi:Raf kinase inhibitor-like YbhB/YbcL family protein
MVMTLTSSAFEEAGSIPAKCTCEGANVSPPLAWSRVPEETWSLALILDDPDAPDPKVPRMTWVHWVVYDVPASTTGLREAAGLPDCAKAGLYDWREPRYGGPCPPIGRHRGTIDRHLPEEGLSASRVAIACGPRGLCSFTGSITNASLTINGRTGRKKSR